MRISSDPLDKTPSGRVALFLGLWRDVWGGAVGHDLCWHTARGDGWYCFFTDTNVGVDEHLFRGNFLQRTNDFTHVAGYDDFVFWDFSHL